MRSERRARLGRWGVRRTLATCGVAVTLGAVAALDAAGAARAGEAWAPAAPGRAWSFPRDHHAQPEYRNEWWYFTGVVSADGEPARRFGYQLTLFRVGLVRDPPRLDSALATGDAVMGHAAVTDLSAGTHVFSEVLWRAAPPLGGFGVEAEAVLAWARAPPGTAGRWTVTVVGDGAFALSMRDDAKGIALDLRVQAERPVLLQGSGGYSRKSAREGYASLYYSYTRLATEGTITAGGRTWRVSGTSWMDRELGSSQLAPEQGGWDWWSLRLDDGRDVTLYALRRKDGSVDFRRGSVLGADGKVTLLGPDGFEAEPTGRWKSPATGAVYPSGWRVRVPAAALDVAIEPELREAENASALLPGLSYWEGPVRVLAGGKRVGEGYAELTGYVGGGKLPL
jgi:predicted secreted hydrolase